jgi:hypothetical protein
MEAEKDRHAHDQSKCVVRHGLAVLEENRLRQAAYAWPYNTPAGAERRSGRSDALGWGGAHGGAPAASSAAMAPARSAASSSAGVRASIDVLSGAAAAARNASDYTLLLEPLPPLPRNKSHAAVLSGDELFVLGKHESASAVHQGAKEHESAAGPIEVEVVQKPLESRGAQNGEEDAGAAVAKKPNGVLRGSKLPSNCLRIAGVVRDANGEAASDDLRLPPHYKLLVCDSLAEKPAIGE